MTVVLLNTACVYESFVMASVDNTVRQLPIVSEHALVDMTHHWHSVVDKCQSVRIVFVDFAKAFDHIDHNILVDRMQSLGLSDVIVRWMCAFLEGRHQRVKIGDVLSDWLLECPKGLILDH